MKKGEFTSKGFTIIEVSLVLAIAGLIFLMVFIALPALQRQSRDTQRKEDVAGLISAIKKYQTNNRGALPTDSGKFNSSSVYNATGWSGLLQDYLADGFEDPSTGDQYTLMVESCLSSAGSTGQVCNSGEWSNVITGDFQTHVGTMYVVTQAKCSGDESTGVVATANTRKLAVLYRLEGSGLYCENT